MFFTLPAERLTPASEPEIRFMETPRGAPPAIKTWWYPGETMGHEFIYPKEQAQRLAKAVKEPVLTTQRQTTTAEQTNTSDLSRVASNGGETRVSAESRAPASAPTGTPQPGEVAPASIEVQAVTVPAPSGSTDSGTKAIATSGSPAKPTPTPAKSSPKHLPKTGSPMPLAGLIGLCLIASAASIRFWRAVHR
jgi:LPXTG-motif cell wall-anchored protein